MRVMMRTVRFLVGAVILSGCGRYMAPVPPEMLAPVAVENLVVTPSDTGMFFSWSAPEKDRRGRELKDFDGYSVERKEISKRGDETDPSIRFTELAFISDTHIEKRDELREEARAAGKISRTVKAPAELTKFSYTDGTPRNGVTYIYQIVPTNNGGVKGQVGQVIKVAFQGAQSAVMLTNSQEMEDLAAAQLPPQ
jgi:hypothetical protein